MDRERLIITFVVAVVYCFMLWPLPTLIVAAVIVIGYFLFTQGTMQNSIERGRERRRKEALSRAQVYLGYYSDIWRNLRLSNPYCYLNLAADGLTITGFEKVSDGSSYRTFTVLESKVSDLEEVWNMFCKAFRYNTSYDGLKESCWRFNLVIEEKILGLPEKTQEAVIKPAVRIDINNATVEELTDLPGISAIMAKKAVKRREDIGGFKSIKEFFDYLKIKPHMQENLLSLLTVSEMQGYKKVDKSQERSIDL